MGYYDIALICKNGHVINDSFKEYPELNTKFCKECGSITIYSCQKCNTPIRGDYNMPGIAFLGGGMETAPAYCHECGNAYPWTEEKLKAIQEVMSLGNLTKEDKDDFDKNLNDIVSETPRTKVAALKIKMIGQKVTNEIWEVAKGIIVEIASETAKKTIGL
ncbi:DUF2321 domain-containing protein [Tissierella sp.]|uniref:DUF2321 domain-containing protein n=1 Tax=Tissierella sp. TaxID=41274 RepID=UPI0028568650|nr:DUF2321 domain-containing protein [Tissierella sp.]MDR7856097.1 DUF2321 domain-containing protein [Tissierella sp.]